MKTLQLAPSSIIIEENRQRKDIGDLIFLAQSIEKHGLINPPAVNKTPEGFVLIAGERRTRACLMLGLETIPVHVYENVEPWQYKAIELAENIHRKDLSWKEDAEAVLDFHEYMCGHEDYQNEEWKIEDTASFLAISQRGVSRRLRVARALRAGHERVASCVTLSAAHNVLEREDSRAIQTSLADALDPIYEDGADIGSGSAGCDGYFNHLNQRPSPLDANGDDDDYTLLAIPGGKQLAEAVVIELQDCLGKGNGTIPAPSERFRVLAGDARDLFANYAGPRFNLLHLDPPYGIAHHQSDQGSAAVHGTYDDSEDAYWSYLEALFASYHRVMQKDSHILLWFSMKHYTKTRGRIWSWCKDYDIPFFADHPVNSHPLIWYKSDNTGIVPDAQRGPRQIYESCFFISLGDRKIVRTVANVIAHPVNKHKAKHLSEKPLPVVEHFLSMLVDDTTVMGDFCCGSGTALGASLRLGARAGIGMDLDTDCVQIAEEQIRWASQNPLKSVD